MRERLCSILIGSLIAAAGTAEAGSAGVETLPIEVALGTNGRYLRSVFIRAALPADVVVSDESIERVLDDIVAHIRNEFEPYEVIVNLYEAERCGIDPLIGTAHYKAVRDAGHASVIADFSRGARRRNLPADADYSLDTYILRHPGVMEDTEPPANAAAEMQCFMGVSGTFGVAPPFRADTPCLVPPSVTLATDDLMQLDTYGGSASGTAEVVDRRRGESGVELDIRFPEGASSGPLTVVSAEYGGSRELTPVDLSPFDALSLRFSVVAVDGRPTRRANFDLYVTPVVDGRIDYERIPLSEGSTAARVASVDLRNDDSRVRAIGFRVKPRAPRRSAMGDIFHLVTQPLGLDWEDSRADTTLTVRVELLAGTEVLPPPIRPRKEFTLSAPQLLLLDHEERRPREGRASVVARRAVEGGMEVDLRFEPGSAPVDLRVVSSSHGGSGELAWLDVRGYESFSLKLTVVAINGDAEPGDDRVRVGTYTSRGYANATLVPGAGLRSTVISQVSFERNHLARIGFHAAYEPRLFSPRESIVTLRVEPVEGVPPLTVRHPRMLAVSDEMLMALDCSGGALEVLDRRDVPGPGVELRVRKPMGGVSARTECLLDTAALEKLNTGFADGDVLALKYTLIEADFAGWKEKEKPAVFFGPFAGAKYDRIRTRPSSALPLSTDSGGVRLSTPGAAGTFSIDMSGEPERVGTFLSISDLARLPKDYPKERAAATATVRIEPVFRAGTRGSASFDVK